MGGSLERTKSKDYTYSYYRIYETDLERVKANKSSWGAVYGSTVFYPYDTTYILQRSPVMVNITWKYDDGDVTTSHWVGRALTEPCDRCITDVSECLRRTASLTADTHSRLLTLFCPSLPRVPSVVLCERLYAAVQQVFQASMLLPPSYHPDARFLTEAQGLCRMGELLRREIDALPRLAKGKSDALPDTYAYHAELTRVRAAIAMHVMHGEGTSEARHLHGGTRDVAMALSEAYTALLALVAEAV